MPTWVHMLPCVYKLHLSVIHTQPYFTHVHLPKNAGMMHILGACNVLLIFPLRVYMLVGIFMSVHMERSIRNLNGSCGFYFIAYNLNRYIFRNINAIGFLFLTQHTTPVLYVKIHFGVLHMRGTDVTGSDTP